MGDIISFIIIGGVVLGIAMLAVQHRKKVLRNWKAAAQSLGLTFHGGNLLQKNKITGDINNHHVSVRTATRGSGKNSKTVTEYHVQYAKSVPFSFKLTKQHFFHSFGKMFGMQDIEVGDKSFDDNVIVQSSNTAQICDFLTAPRRKHIKTALSSFKEITISHTGVEVVTYGMESSIKKLTTTINSLCAMSEAICPSRDKEHPIEKAKTARINGDIARAVEIIAGAEGLNEDETIEIDEIEGQLRYVGGDSKRASEIFEALTNNMNGDDYSTQWKLLANEKNTDSSTKSDPIPATTSTITEETTAQENIPEANDTPQTATELTQSTQTAVDPISMENFCNTVFSSNLSAFDSTKLFDSSFKRQKIAWSGKLIAASSFSFDFIFKDGAGVKATYEIFDLQSTYTTKKIKAIVRFPENKLDELKQNIGSENSNFTGELVSLDGLSKNIFIISQENQS